MKYLNEILGIRYPFIQGGMANIATGEFAAAVSNAGAMGLIGTGGMNAEELLKNIRRCRELTDKPFGVNLMLLNPETDQMADIVVREHIPFVTTGAGMPGKYIGRWKENGILVAPVISSVLMAKRMVRDGADFIIAEGMESGGHIGEMTTMALVPQMVDGVDVPVIAAGGIADGRGVAAAFALGACGIQMGTCLLVSEECPVHENYKKALLKAGDNATCVTGRSVNADTRIIRNRMARKYLALEKGGAERMELEKYTLGSLRRAVFDGDVETGSLMAGQDCGELKSIRPLAEIFRDMAEGAESAARNLADQASAWG
ncbi:nitronate monooxygenase [Clostridium vitabionis]|uniref:nitronate monooxygenase n=1 Tax=Clostridium vitabionis TaxID=2784388 RepID=UPI00188CCE26|nr:nitronate monooxygenase [Clostridium vitabionis]